MSPEALFIITLLMGIVFIYVAKKLVHKVKFILIITGILFMLFGGFGVFTSLL